MTHTLSVRLLKLSAAGTALFSFAILMSLVPGNGTFNNFIADVAHLPLDGLQRADSETERVLLAIVAGLMIGVSTFVWLVTHHIFAKNPTLGAKILIPSLLAWYIPDNIGSLLAGAWFNVLANTVFLTLFLAPILLAKRPAPQIEVS